MLSISIIVPVYNVKRFLPICLDSIIQQNLSSYEVILIDDGSTDGSEQICDEYTKNNSSFKVIHQDNKGISAARNIGFNQAKGEYIMFVDSDDYLIKNTLAYLLQIAKTNTLEILELKHVNVKEEENTPSIINAQESDNIEILNGMEFMSRRNFTSQAWGYIILRDFLKNNNIIFPEGHMLEDAAYPIRLFLYAQRIAKSSIVSYCYRTRFNSVMNDRTIEHQFKLLDDYVFAAADINSIITDHKDCMNEKFIEQCVTRRDNYVFFGAIRAFKLGKAFYFIDLAKKNGVYPFPRLNRNYYPGLKYMFLHWCISRPFIFNGLSKIYTSVN